MNPPDSGGYDVNELAERARVSVRTVRYYIQQGLLPRQGQTGPGVRYGEDYLSRLRLIRRLQAQHLPLVEIRKQLGSLSDPEMEAALNAPQSSAIDYVRSLTGTSPGVVRASSEPRFAPSINLRAGRGQEERSHWERIALTEDIELHVRRPLSRHANRRVERLLELARRIFEE
jgi:DNA-binding transcriptional MerR regulator